MYFLLRGSLELKSRPPPTEGAAATPAQPRITHLQEGKSFGEFAVTSTSQENRARLETVTATSPCLVATLTRQDWIKSVKAQAVSGVVALMKHHPAMRTAKRSALYKMCLEMSPVKFFRGQVIARMGELPDRLIFLTSGGYTILADDPALGSDVQVSQMHVNSIEIIGGQMMYDEKLANSATIIASKNTEGHSVSKASAKRVLGRRDALKWLERQQHTLASFVDQRVDATRSSAEAKAALGFAAKANYRSSAPSEREKPAIPSKITSAPPGHARPPPCFRENLNFVVASAEDVKHQQQLSQKAQDKISRKSPRRVELHAPRNPRAPVATTQSKDSIDAMQPLSPVHKKPPENNAYALEVFGYLSSDESKAHPQFAADAFPGRHQAPAPVLLSEGFHGSQTSSGWGSDAAEPPGPALARVGRSLDSAVPATAQDSRGLQRASHSVPDERGHHKHPALSKFDLMPQPPPRLLKTSHASTRVSSRRTCRLLKSSVIAHAVAVSVPQALGTQIVLGGVGRFGTMDAARGSSSQSWMRPSMISKSGQGFDAVNGQRSQSNFFDEEKEREKDRLGRLSSAGGDGQISAAAALSARAPRSSHLVVQRGSKTDRSSNKAAPGAGVGRMGAFPSLPTLDRRSKKKTPSENPRGSWVRSH